MPTPAHGQESSTCWSSTLRRRRSSAVIPVGYQLQRLIRKRLSTEDGLKIYCWVLNCICRTRHEISLTIHDRCAPKTTSALGAKYVPIVATSSTRYTEHGKYAEPKKREVTGKKINQKTITTSKNARAPTGSWCSNQYQHNITTNIYY